MGKKVNIIGAGLAGLSAGICLQQEGIETELFELAPWAGGMCTAWFRKGYRFDGCIHWMVGTRKGDPIYNLYKEVGALTDDTIIYNTANIQIEIDGRVYDVPMDLKGFKTFLISLSEQDNAAIEAFCKDIGVMMRSKMMIGAPSNLSEVFDMLKSGRGFLRLSGKYLNKTVGTYAAVYKSGIIRKLLTQLMPAGFSAIALVMMLGTRMANNAGYPMGGASDVILRMEQKYKALGGKISLNSRVDEIIVMGGEAKGVRSKGIDYPSDGVVAACDAYDTLEKMLGGKYNHPQLEEMLKSAPLFEPLAIVSFGLNKKLGIPFSVTYECTEGITVAPGVKQYGYNLRAFDFDTSAAPPDGSSVMAMFEAPLDYWEKLRNENPESYRLQKEQLAEEVASLIEARYPGFKDAVCIVDVATPATYKRLTNVYKGSFEGFAPTPSALKMRIKKTIPGLKRFCICGQWTTAGGGICTAIADGKTAAKLIKKEIGKQ